MDKLIGISSNTETYFGNISSNSFEELFACSKFEPISEVNSLLKIINSIIWQIVCQTTLLQCAFRHTVISVVPWICLIYDF